MVRLHTRMPSLRSSPRILSAPQSRLFLAISWIKAMISSATFGLWEEALDLRFSTGEIAPDAIGAGYLVAQSRGSAARYEPAWPAGRGGCDRSWRKKVVSLVASAQ